ncbi:MAG: hypothetical protein HY205_01270 [Nitrospirae bacterium]|nr:hypothetical protein [Nitrospirota bacterium]
MKVRQYLKPILIRVALAAVGLSGFVAGTASVVQAAEPMKIEVVVTDQEFKVSGHTLVGELTEITVRNQGTMTHGFTSPLLNDVGVKVEGDAHALKGKGVNAYHVDPGKTMKISFTRHSKSDPETMRYVFWCDIHPNMKGELFVIETKGEIGGG